MKFPTPWQIEQTGPSEFAVLDKNGLKLFFVVADIDGAEPDEEPGTPSGPTMLGTDNDTDTIILNELDEILGRIE